MGTIRPLPFPEGLAQMLVTILLVALSLFALASVAWFVVVEFVVHKRADAETAKPTPDFAELAQDHP
ncbi:MAG: hypothetical protein U0Q14_08570 [Dermatophilaceae bacterium]